MRKLLLIAATLGGLSAIASTGATAASAAGAPAVQQAGQIVQANYDRGHHREWHRHGWHHRHHEWERRHWRHYN